MALRNYINTSKEAQLLNPIGTGDTTITLDAPGLVNIPSTPFYVRLDPDTASEELILVGAGSSATTLMNCTRGYDGTSAFTHTAGAKARHCVAAEFYNKADVHVEASTNVHGLSGGAAVVGTTQSQTLTNKTVNASIIDVAHSTSPAASQAVKVSADSVAARDGFVWDNTGGSSGRSIVVRAGGVDRFVVSGAGLITSNSATGTDKALSVQQSATERLFIQNDGTVDVGLQAAGSAGDRVTIRTRPTQNALRIKNEAAANIFTVGASGNVDASGYLATATNLSATGSLTVGTTASVGTNLTVSGTAGVTGTSTLTGDTTWPLPAASVTPRLEINSRTGGIAIRSKRQDGTVTYEIGADGGGVANGKWFVHDKNSPVIAKVTSTAVVPSPVTGMIVFDITDKTLREYNGATWDVVGRYGTEYSGARGAFYYQSGAAQSIPTGADQRIRFDANLRTIADITTSTVGSGTVFTINRSGLWTVSASLRYSAGANDTERYLAIANGALTTRFAEASSVSNTSTAALPIALSLTKTIPVTAGDTITILAFQSDTGAINLDLTYLRSTSVSFVWEGV